MRALRSVLAIIGIALVGCAETPTASAPHDVRAEFSATARTVPITVMTRNLYLGANLAPMFALTDPNEIPFTVAGLWADVVANDFPARVVSIVNEIAGTEPQLIGLQEVAHYTLMGAGQPVVLDYLAVLLAELGARGLDYRVAAEVKNIDLTLPIFLPPQSLGQIEYYLRDVILARGDVQVANPAGFNYQTTLPLSAAGIPIVVPRGWTAVDATRHGTTVRFVNTHLEAFHPLVNQLQAMELADILGPENRAVILAGDINSGPGDPDARPAYTVLQAAGFEDAWTTANPGKDGFTCCFPDHLEDDLERPLFMRIDMVLFRQPSEAGPSVDHVSATLVGAAEGDRIWSDAVGALLWPSDHAGVAATLHHRWR
jgi:endonuclease/exonuclease/phosphatase family metal-dependent hydrolase